MKQLQLYKNQYSYYIVVINQLHISYTLMIQQQACHIHYEIDWNQSKVNSAMFDLLFGQPPHFMVRLCGIVLNFKWKETRRALKNILEVASTFFAMQSVTITLPLGGLRLAMGIVMLSILLCKCLACRRRALPPCKLWSNASHGIIKWRLIDTKRCHFLRGTKSKRA